LAGRLEGEIMVDFIGRVETLTSDLKRLHDLYGIVTDPIPWLNKSTDKENTPTFTDRTEIWYTSTISVISKHLVTTNKAL